MKLLIKNKLYLSGADQELKSYLREILTVENPQWIEAQTFGRYSRHIPRELSQYAEDKRGVLELPRGILAHLTQDLDRDFQIVDERVSPVFDFPPPGGNVTLRKDDQAPAIETLLRHESGFLSAPAGTGKTILGLEVCRRLGMKTLWLTHRTELLDQVVGTKQDPEGEAYLVLGLRRDDVGLLQRDTWRVGAQLTVGMIPTMRKRDLSEISKSFGLIIVDEAHHIPSSSFLEVVGNFYSKRIYGLTATAYRSDKLEPLMFNAVGPIVSRIKHVKLFEDERLIKPTIRIRHTGWCPKDHQRLEYSDFMDLMVGDTDRNNLIVKDVIKECRPGNTFAILVDRTRHAEVLVSLLKSKGIKCDYVVGSVDVPGDGKKKRAIPKKVRDAVIAALKSGSLQGIVATYDLLAEGFNHPPLNRLFLASPVKYRGTVIQAIGRVQRPAEGKSNALVLDYVDSAIAMFDRQAEARLRKVYNYMAMPVEDPRGDFFTL